MKFQFLIHLLILSLFILNVNAQTETVSSTIVWDDSTRSIELSDFKIHEVLYFENASYNLDQYSTLPILSKRFKINNEGILKVRLVNTNYTKLSESEQLLISSFNNKISANPVIISSSIVYDRTEKYGIVEVLPFRNNNGEIEKLISFNIEYSIQPNSTLLRKNERNTYASNSVLATGNWYKLAISQEGIYKLDKSYLSSLGIDVSNINPKNIRVYGNGGGMLPQANSEFRYDDLQENSIYVSGEADNVFNDGDFVLFYGSSPHQWIYDSVSNNFKHIFNIYSDYSYYFLTVDLGSGKRIENQPSSSLQPNLQVSDFNEYQFIETDLKNLQASGREFYGDEFQYENERNYTFNVPNIISNKNTYIKARFASRSIGSGETFTMTSNGIGDNIYIVPTTSTYTDTYAYEGTGELILNASNSSVGINIKYTNNTGSSNGWLNFIELNAFRNLTFNGSQLLFRASSSKGATNISQFNLSNISSNTKIWEVTNPINAYNQEYILNVGSGSFVAATPVIKEFVAFDINGSFYTPSSSAKISNQNLHSTTQIDYVIISAPQFIDAANDLATFHQETSGAIVGVYTPQQIYNEFSSGAQDISAIRDFVKMLYEKANTSGYSLPQAMLMFGDGSYDYKDRIANNTNFVPTYESLNSLSPIASFCTDDYFAILDDNEGGNIDIYKDNLDLAIGRLPVSNLEEAFAVVNKIKAYSSSANQGSWQNVLTMLSDDEDGNTHFKDAEEIGNYLATNFPVWNIDKIYVDAFQQVTTTSGQRAPDVNTAIRNRIYNGTLMFNYLGHGGISGLAAERILQLGDIDTWNNCSKMPLFVTATCEFTKFDDPENKSAGEVLMMKPDGGAIALVTTLRLVYASANKVLNSGFTYSAFTPFNNYYRNIGDAFRIGKNNTLASGTDIQNTRKFMLIGDPMMFLDYPKNNIITTEINNQPIQSGLDTLKALEKITVKGKVVDANGNTLTSFNGRVYPTIYDKAQNIQTFGDKNTQKKIFKLQKNILYRGKSTVTNGEFTFTFIVPKDINYQFGSGKFSYYAENGDVDANGFRNDVIIGGTSDSTSSDNIGPEIKLFMNDEKFAFGGLTDENPYIFLKLKDANGINTTGNGIGHDVSGVLDENTASSFIMNDFYEATQDDYTSGSVRYPLKDLSIGRHQLDVKCWDVYNNSSTAYTEFVVASSAKLALDHVLNYPNPFTTQTEFMFEHNMPGSNLTVMVEIYSVSGKLIKTIRTNILNNSTVTSDKICGDENSSSNSYRVDGIMWDGTDDYGDLIGKGVYVYRISVLSDNGMKANKLEKLVVLK